MSKDFDQTETAPRKFKLGPLGNLNQVTKGLAKTIRAMADGTVDSQVGARICNGLGIMRACMETQKLEQLEARMNLGEPFDRRVPLHNSCRHDRNILCDQPRIEAIVLGQHAAGAGELTKLVRVDTSHRHSRREQGTDDSALVTTARLKANCGDCERAQPYD